MRRKYKRELFANRIETIKKYDPSTCIGVDVIVGFPGESDEDFDETMDFLKDLPISYLHVFTYSERAKTTAIKMADPVPMEKRKERSRKLHILSEKKKRAFYEEQIGKEMIVLFEGEENEEFMFGFTPNYVKVKVPFNADWTNQLLLTKLDSIERDGTMKGLVLQHEMLSA